MTLPMELRQGTDLHEVAADDEVTGEPSKNHRTRLANHRDNGCVNNRASCNRWSLRQDAETPGKAMNALSRAPSIHPHLLVRESFCAFVAFLACPSWRLRLRVKSN